MVSQVINNKKVYVGLSGGVDSAVSAALLKKQGYEVTGVFIKAWTPEGYPCTWKEDRRSAMRVAAVLEIPFVTLDLEKEYKQEVVDYMISEYKKGRTPNPDVMCNKEIKFGSFFDWAMKNGADFVATGHYAQLYFDKKENRYFLKESRDKDKDQSYFLWTLTKDILEKVIFPIGKYKKEEVRKLANKFKLPQATRKDSQGLCFLGQIDMKDFLKTFIDEKMGNVLNTYGEIIGKHNGATFFTIGERHGFNIQTNSSEQKTMYVIKKDISNNTITVADKLTILKEKNEIELEQSNIEFSSEIFNKDLYCRLRYRQNRLPCKIAINNGVIQVKITETNKSNSLKIGSSGQSLVLYRGDVCLGGGIMR